MTYTNILATIHTTLEQERFLLELKALDDILYTKTLRKEAAISQTIGVKRASLLEELIQGTQTETRKNIAKLYHEVEVLPVARLTVAYEFTEQVVSSLHAFMLQYIKNPFVINLIINSSVVAGALLEYNGKYIDLTLGKKITTYFDTNRESVTKILRQYAS